MNHFVLIGGWIYARHPAVYREFVKLGCKAVFIGCGAGHYQGCPKGDKDDCPKGAKDDILNIRPA